MPKAPIAFFTYKRPEHTLRSLISLAENQGAAESELYIFCDAPKCEKDQETVEQVRAVVRSQKWCRTVHVIEQTTNQGCANSVIQGVTKLCQEYGKVIVIEDDLVLSPFFLDYMNRALDAYTDASTVMQISGYMFPVQIEATTDAVFLPFTTSWGWATWQRAWQYFDPKMSGYQVLHKDRRFRRQFNLNDSYPYFSMLEAQRNGRIDSWAIRWYLSVFMQQGLTLYPVRSLVSNTGFDGSGTHCGTQDDLGTNSSSKLQYSIISFPITTEVNIEVSEVLFNYLRNSRKSKLPLSKIIRNLSRIAKFKDWNSSF